MGRLIDVAFPYRARRPFGAASFALVFLLIVAEVEALGLMALGIVAHRFDLFIALQEAILPAACFVALAGAATFWWRARSWTKRRVASLDLWAGGGSAFGERLAKDRTPR